MQHSRHTTNPGVEPAAVAGGLPRLLAGTLTGGPMRLERHTAIHGPVPPPAFGLRKATQPLIDELERAGLRGRGGAAFPIATKMKAVAAAPGRAVVLANACEGEPLSVKDRLLLESLPHLVLDGALFAARAVGGDEIVIAIEESAVRAQLAVDLALRERQDLAGARPRLRLETIPSGYVSGQESAVVNYLGGGPSKPTMSPRVYERGIRRRPTFVSNVETLAHIALIARHGAAWFREFGTDSHPGSTLVTVSGAVARRGVLEIGYGTPLASVIDAAGGPSRPVRAFLLGGYAGNWVAVQHGYQLMLSGTDLGALGAGIIFALPASACAVAEVANIASWLAEQSAGQCGPCVHGLPSIAMTLTALQAGEAGDRGLQRIARWASLVQRRGACAHPDGAARFVTSAVNVFAEEFADHAQHGACEACRRQRVLPTPALATRLAA